MGFLPIEQVCRETGLLPQQIQSYREMPLEDAMSQFLTPAQIIEINKKIY
tara:strand:- start:325 stop:474 length:150 start_codon:yes stop_codon:yes gene_type:complete